MSVITIRDGRSQAEIAVHRGFNCFRFQTSVGERTVDVLAAQDGFENGEGQPSHSGIPILFPFPNRIREGKYTWEGREYQMPLSPGHPNTIHGFCYNRPWRVVEQGDDFVVGRFQLSVDGLSLLEYWPSDFIIDVRYAVAGAKLLMGVKVKNPGDQPLPWGFGTHAYFRLPLGTESSSEQCTIQAPASEEWVLEDCLPTGERRPVGNSNDLRQGVRLDGRKLDDVMTGLSSTHGQIETVITDADAGLRVRQRFPDDFRELVVFTPPWMTAVCMEPYTCVTDAINLQPRGVDAGWRSLGPGEVWETEILIAAEPIG